MPDFIDADLPGARFENVELGGAQFRRVDLTDAHFDEVDLTGVVMRDVDLCDVDISAHVSNLTINGVDVGPLIEAELDARHPLRAAMRPTTVAGFRESWDIVERFWAETVQQARGLSPEALHESVGGEWSFIETLRHLVFATDSWVKRAIHGNPSPWDALGLPWDGMPDTPGVPRDRMARPSLDTVLALRVERMSTVRGLIEGLTDETLEAQTMPVEGPGWPPPRPYVVRKCLLIILNEEWEHHLYARRDLAILEAAGPS